MFPIFISIDQFNQGLLKGKDVQGRCLQSLNYIMQILI